MMLLGCLGRCSTFSSWPSLQPLQLLCLASALLTLKALHVASCLLQYPSWLLLQLWLLLLCLLTYNNQVDFGISMRTLVHNHVCLLAHSYCLYLSCYLCCTVFSGGLTKKAFCALVAYF